MSFYQMKINFMTGDLGWNPFVTSWIETREAQQEKASLTILFDKYIPTMSEVCSILNLNS